MSSHGSHPRGQKHPRSVGHSESSATAADEQHTAAASAPKKAKSSHSHPTSTNMQPTVRDLISDSLAPLANAYWAPGAASLSPFDPQIIESIYLQHLAPINTKAKQREEREAQASAGKHDVDMSDADDLRRLAEEEESEQNELDTQRTQRLLLLELSAYLENYLWKYFDAEKATFAHLMSIVMLLNQKFKENLLSIWESFESRPEAVLIALFERLLHLKQQHDLSVFEANQYLTFLIHAFQSFEHPVVRRVLMKLTTIDCWRTLRESSILRVLRSPESAQTVKGEVSFRDVWKKVEAKPANDFNATFMPNLLIEFVTILYSIQDDSPIFSLDSQPATGKKPRRVPYQIRQHILYLERFLEFLTDCITKLSTRRWVKKLLEEIHFLVLCKQSPLVKRTVQKEKEIQQKQAALASNASTQNRGSDVVDMDTLKATTATSGGAVLSNDNWSNTNASISPLALPGRHFVQMLNIVEYYQFFEIDDANGKPLVAQEVLNAHYLDLQILQKICFKFFEHVPQLKQIALASVSRLEQPDSLRDLLEGVDEAELKDLCVKLQLLPHDEEVAEYKAQQAAVAAPKKSKSASASSAHVPKIIVPLLAYMTSTSFYESILVQSFGIRRNTREEILSMPLYPNEALLFDEHAIPSINYTGDTCLSLPKLSLQFLTLHDYLQRNFKLYQGESTYEIREDIAYTVKRLKPRISADASSTVFTGWARMASPIQSFAVTGALKARIGESKPSLVRAEVTIDLALFSGVVREEWEALQLHDVLFLISVKALVPVHAQINRHAVQQGEDKGRRKFDVEGSDLESSGVVPDESFKALAQEPLLIKYVRGCVVKAVLDGNKRIIGERDDKGNVYKAKGSIRTFRVELDAAQYASDMQKQSQEGVDDIYTSFNLLLRRKPKENNFAGVLETIRDLMADTSSGAANLPEWLRSVFLGYGDPKDSQYYRLANQPDKFEFVDTFLDMQHLKSSFHEKLEIAERSADEIEAEAKGEKELQLVALGEGSNNRQTAASTSIALTRQVRRLVAQAQKDDKSKSATTAEIDSSNSTFRVTFPTEVEPNYQVLQQLLYANDTSMAASVPQPDANVRFMLAEGEQTFKAGGSEQMEDVADASVSKDTAPTAPAPFTKTAPTFTLTEPKKPAAAAASSDSSAADNEAEIAQLSHLTVPKLKEKMKPYNLPTTGAKAQLIERLTEAMRAAAKPAPSSAPTSSAESAEALAAYEKELAAYNEAKSAFEKQLAAFETEKKQHDDAVAAYENSKSVGDGDVEMKDFSAKKGKRGKKAAEESKPAPAAAPATPSAAATIPPSPHTLQVELLPRVHARHGLAKRNLIRFTPTQVEAIKSGLNPGLTLTVGPPGTGKTDVTVQTMSELYHNFPEQRTLIITHSNHALNDIFEKILQRDIDERYLLRLGKGSEDVASESDFSKFGRVNFMLQRRLTLLDEVAALASSLMMNEAVGYTCETAGHFFLEHILARWEKFTSAVDAAQKAKNAELEKVVAANFPFTAYFTSRTEKQNKIWQQYYRSTYGDEAASSMDLSNVSLFRTTSYSEDMSIAVSCWAEIQQTFVELNECAPFELLRSYKDRSNYLLTKHAKVIAMTCTHAAIKHKDFVELGFQFDNLIMEEAAQVLDIETFIPFLLQRNDAVTHKSRLQRIILLGDHHQLPPVIKNRAFSKFSHMDQSLFTRFIRLGMPYIQLNAQGRMRSSLAQLWNWNYQNLGNLPVVNQNPAYQFANVGFVHEFQLINVDDLNGAGESCPTPFFYQNLAEAEYVVQTYMYMRLLGYPASRISIITTYNGQKHLIRDILQQRCANNLLFGLPAKVSTVDKFQGQQNDFILLSLVRTRTAGHLRDVRRLVVAMSRARLGLYVFGRVSLFSNCFELTRTFNQLLQKPTKLQLLPVEKKPMDQGLSTDRPVQALVDPAAILEIRDVVQMSEIVASMTLSVQGEYGEYTRRIQQAAEEERQRREKAQQLAREYAEAREASLRAEAQQQAAMVRETAAAKESEALSREMEDDSAPATKSRRSKQAESESDSDDDK